MRFRDRRDAGRQLARALEGLQPARPLVFAIPRGGVVVGAEVAAHLGAPLLPLVVRKVGAPHNPELAIGAVGPGRVRLHGRLCAELGLSPRDVERAVARARAELAERLARYGAPDRLPDLRGRTAILVDDGLATGATAEVALALLAEAGPERLILAVPVAAPDTLARVARRADACVCLHAPEPFLAVGAHYERFGQVGDHEVLELLRRHGPAAGRDAPPPGGGGPTAADNGARGRAD